LPAKEEILEIRNRAAITTIRHMKDPGVKPRGILAETLVAGQNLDKVR
jgi:hypothetical protein